MSRSLLTMLGAVLVAITTASILAIASPAGSQIAPSLALAPTSGAEVQTGTASVTATLSQPCDAVPDPTAVTATVGGSPLPTSAITVVDAGTFVLTIPEGLVPLEVNAQAPVVAASITCPVAAAPVTLEGGIDMAEIVVTKSVTGTGPTDAIFGIAATCLGEVQDSNVPAVDHPLRASALSDPVTMTMALIAGGSASVFTFSSQICVFSEPDPMGASVVIAPDTVETVTPSGFRVLISNTFGSEPRFTG